MGPAGGPGERADGGGGPAAGPGRAGDRLAHPAVRSGAGPGATAGAWASVVTALAGAWFRTVS